ncbi:L-erythro-3,5-diaminohexanoate dehydrogenase [Streptomyces sp. NPDC001594]|uniref:L-erythro-3,5-diaminohexanoate dehydrogenase n=1 Tax=Streptomyces sp. NPDC001594 TaxID=3364590 RepID=UPI00368C41F0
MTKTAQEGSAIGLHRVLEPAGVLPQAAHRLDTRPQLWRDEVRIRVERLNLDAASYRQLSAKHNGDGSLIRDEVCAIIRERGKMHNPVTGSGGMLVGVVEEVGPDSALGFAVGDRVTTLVSLTLTPLAITDGLRDWDGLSEQVPAEGHAILFGRSVAAVVPDEVPPPVATALMDVCGAPALTARVVADHVARGRAPRVVVIGASGKSGSLSLVAARRAGAAQLIGVVPNEREARRLREAGLADVVVVADARDAVAFAAAVSEAAGGPADVTAVCVDVAGCEGSAILVTGDRGTIIFYSMATSFPAAALGAEGLAADVTMLIGNGYAAGHAEYAFDLLRSEPGVRTLFEGRLAAEAGVDAK